MSRSESPDIKRPHTHQPTEKLPLQHWRQKWDSAEAVDYKSALEYVVTLIFNVPDRLVRHGIRVTAEVIMNNSEWFKW